MVRPLMRAGVPVLKRATQKPKRSSAWLTPELVGSPSRPPGKLLSPTCKSPRMNVPAQSTTARAIHDVAGHAHAGDVPGRLRSRKRHIDKQIFHGFLPQREIRLRFEDSLDLLLIRPLVGLGAGAVHGRPLAAIEHAELDAGGIDGPGHGAPEGVDLADDLSLAHAADGRIAAHPGDGVEIAGQQRRSAPIRAAASAASAPAWPPPITSTSKS